MADAGRQPMSSAPKLLIQTIADVTTVEFQDTRLLESQQLEAVGQELYKLVDRMDRRKLILDFSNVQFLASAAIGVLINLHNKCSAIKGTFVICGMRKDLMRVFEIMKLTKMFKFAAAEDDALAMLGYTGPR